MSELVWVTNGPDPLGHHVCWRCVCRLPGLRVGLPVPADPAAVPGALALAELQRQGIVGYYRLAAAHPRTRH